MKFLLFPVFAAGPRCVDAPLSSRAASYTTEYCEAEPGDSGSPTFAVDYSFAWGPVLLGIHQRPIRDTIATTELRDALRNEILDRQLNVPLAAREVPTFFTGLAGDYDGSFQIDAADLDIIVRESQFSGTRGYNWYLDWTEDGQVDDEDIDIQLAIMTNLLFTAPLLRGDANLDGVVGAADYDIWNNNKFQADKGWADADFNADGNVDGSDFNWIIQNWNE